MPNALFAIYDSGARFFGPPLMSPNLTMFKRSLDLHLRDNPQAPMFEYPDDFIVYDLGMIDEETGAIEPRDPPVRVATIGELMVRRPGTVPPLDVTVPTDTNSGDFQT